MASPARSKILTSAIAAAVTATTVLAPAAAASGPAVSQSAAAAGPDRGLFGSQDPTYDGAYRQGLAILGLVAVDRAVPRPAVRWLLRQQCRSGAFLAHRPDPSRRCPAPDPDAFTGPDSNSTALAAMALRAVGERKAARRATRYLRTMQNRDGGFAYYRGGASDTNSTGLALATLNGVKRTPAVRADIRAANRYMRATQLRCAADRGDRGLVSFVATPKEANVLASAQAALGQVTTLPVRDDIVVRQRAPKRLLCRDGRQVSSASVQDALLDGLARRLVRGKGMLPSATGPGTDPSATAQAALALAAAGRSRPAVKVAVRALRRAAAGYTGVRTVPDAGRLGTLLLLADGVNAKPRRFGGVDLVGQLRRTMR